ncbi:MAG: YsnF/AvaK domain-containing protein [Myxococcaceae bacterium]|nr:YsnF/AvaK domain-containing protein [Myxococcaceae bacterium]
MFAPESVRQGMTVYSNDGEKLGKIIASGADNFQIEKGFFFPKDYIARYDDIREVAGGKVYLSRDAAALRAGVAEAAVPRVGGEAEWGFREESVQMPLYREELEVRKRSVVTGDVAAHKKVVTETRTVDVPLRREVVHVEHIPAERVEGVRADYEPFRDETISLTLHKEEVDVVKRPVLAEQVRLRRTPVETERRVADTIRHEEVELLTHGEAELEEEARGFRAGTEAERTYQASSEEGGTTRS